MGRGWRTHGYVQSDSLQNTEVGVKGFMRLAYQGEGTPDARKPLDEGHPFTFCAAHISAQNVWPTSLSWFTQFLDEGILFFLRHAATKPKFFMSYRTRGGQIE